ncbi:MAG: hypothetical protein LBK01_08195 [Burkholderiaceae bacterium]|jgi:hypothetical protein|nr:hypothetical protein [Burkholderiaceae bacterium]
MSSPLIPGSLLQSADKVLFLSCMDIPAYIPLQNYLRALAEWYPHLDIHIWVGRENSRDESPLSLSGWLNACSFIGKAYTRTETASQLKQSVTEAQGEEYPLLVSLAETHVCQYINLAREISPAGFVVGLKEQGLMSLFHRTAHKKLNAAVPLHGGGKHLPRSGEIYADWFACLFGLTVEEEARSPFIDIPLSSLHQADVLLKKWGIDRIGEQVVFINISNNVYRGYSPAHAVELVRALRERDSYRNAWFLINAPLEDTDWIKQKILLHCTDSYSFERVRFLRLTEPFFQFAAVLSLCDLLVSTASNAVYLADALNIPVIMLTHKREEKRVPLLSVRRAILVAGKNGVNGDDLNRVMDSLGEKGAVG